MHSPAHPSTHAPVHPPPNKFAGYIYEVHLRGLFPPAEAVPTPPVIINVIPSDIGGSRLTKANAFTRAPQHPSTRAPVHPPPNKFAGYIYEVHLRGLFPPAEAVLTPPDRKKVVKHRSLTC